MFLLKDMGTVYVRGVKHMFIGEERTTSAIQFPLEGPFVNGRLYRCITP